MGGLSCDRSAAPTAAHTGSGSLEVEGFAELQEFRGQRFWFFRDVVSAVGGYAAVDVFGQGLHRLFWSMSSITARQLPSMPRRPPGSW